MLKFLKRKKNKDSEKQTENTEDNKSTDNYENSLSESQPPSDEASDAKPRGPSLDELESSEPPPDKSAMQTEPPKEEASEKRSFFGRLKESLTKTRKQLTLGLSNLFLGRKVLDDELLDELETQLIMADVGVEATENIIDQITEGISRKEIKDPQSVLSALKSGLLGILEPCEQPLVIPKLDIPYVLLMVGVNGSGKTTTIGKLAKQLQAEGKSVMLAAGDTFRAAAVEQLQIWGERNQVPVVAQHTGADSASVIFDAFASARAKGIDVLIADTAGRLHTRDNLMEELKKVLRVLKKLDSSAPHEVMLVLDAGIGQNALIQAEKFHEAVQVTGLTLTKIDGTAKGGIIFAIAQKLKLPIRFLGCGEKIDDLRQFEAEEFIEALFSVENQSEE